MGALVAAGGLIRLGSGAEQRLCKLFAFVEELRSNAFCSFEQFLLSACACYRSVLVACWQCNVRSPLRLVPFPSPVFFLPFHATLYTLVCIFHHTNLVRASLFLIPASLLYGTAY